LESVLKENSILAFEIFARIIKEAKEKTLLAIKIFSLYDLTFPKDS